MNKSLFLVKLSCFSLFYLFIVFVRSKDIDANTRNIPWIHLCIFLVAICRSFWASSMRFSIIHWSISMWCVMWQLLFCFVTLFCMFFQGHLLSSSCSRGWFWCDVVFLLPVICGYFFVSWPTCFYRQVVIFFCGSVLFRFRARTSFMTFQSRPRRQLRWTQIFFERFPTVFAATVTCHLLWIASISISRCDQRLACIPPQTARGELAVFSDVLFHSHNILKRTQYLWRCLQLSA